MPRPPSSAPSRQLTGPALVDEHSPTPFSPFTTGQVFQALRALQVWISDEHRQGRVPVVTLSRYASYRREAVDAAAQEPNQQACGQQGDGARAR